jgi:SAM-dependent methyltransferase/uncharacterized protein YbaR (Trm112 family)
MLKSTLDSLRCPACAGDSLVLEAKRAQVTPLGGHEDVMAGTIRCADCAAAYPILAGVAVLVPEVGEYLLGHVKGIAKLVADDEIPVEFREDYLTAREELEDLGGEHIEEDLEAERVNALYLMTHYLRADGGPESRAWIRPDSGGGGSPLIERLIAEHWDRGPFAAIEGWVDDLGTGLELVELGCGVGGLGARLAPRLKRYLGIDSSFASVALGRHLLLGAEYRGELRIPGDLLAGSVSRELTLSTGQAGATPADLVVGDLSRSPLRAGRWDLSVALNTIDMLDDPSGLPELQKQLLRAGGWAVQSCPYVWHEAVSRRLRAELPPGVSTSSQAAEWLYSQAGFAIERREEHLPWLFFKHLRQLEIYSVHAFLARLAK